MPTPVAEYQIPLRITNQNKEVKTEFQTVNLSDEENKITFNSLGKEELVISFDENGTTLKIDNTSKFYDFLKPADDEEGNTLVFKVHKVRMSHNNNFLIEFENTAEKNYTAIELTGKTIVKKDGLKNVEVKQVDTQNITLPKNFFNLLESKKINAKNLPAQFFDIIPFLPNADYRSFRVGSRYLKIAKIMTDKQSEPTFYVVNRGQMIKFYQADTFAKYDDKKGFFGIKIANNQEKDKSKIKKTIGVNNVNKETFEEIEKFIGKIPEQLTNDAFSNQFVSPSLIDSESTARKSFTIQTEQEKPQETPAPVVVKEEKTDNKQTENKENKNNKDGKEDEKNKDKKDDKKVETVDLTPLFKVTGLIMSLFGIFTGFGGLLWMIISLGTGSMAYAYENKLSKVKLSDYSFKSKEKAKVEKLGKNGMLASKVLDVLLKDKETYPGIVNAMENQINEKLKQINNSRPQFIKSVRNLDDIQVFDEKVAKLQEIKQEIHELKELMEKYFNNAIETYTKLHEVQKLKPKQLEQINTEVKKLEEKLKETRQLITSDEKSLNDPSNQPDKKEIELNIKHKQQEEEQIIKALNAKKALLLTPEEQVKINDEGTSLMLSLDYTVNKIHKLAEDFNQTLLELDKKFLKQNITPILDSFEL